MIKAFKKKIIGAGKIDFPMVVIKLKSISIYIHDLLSKYNSPYFFSYLIFFDPIKIIQF